MTAPLRSDSLARAKVYPFALRPLRIALFAGNYNYVMDGPVKALNKLVAHLESRGHEVLVFAPTTSRPVIYHAGELVSIPSAALPGKRSEYRVGFGLFGEAKRRLNAFRPDLIHIAAPDITGFAALKYGEKRGIPCVASYHTRFDTYPRYYNAAWAEPRVSKYLREFYARCVHVYSPSPSLVETLIGEGYRDNFRLWQRGVDRRLFNPARRDWRWRESLGFAGDDIVILFVGRLVLEKGIDVCCRTIELARKQKPQIKALVVGEGPERAAFERQLGSGVFTGYLSGVDLARAYASADIFLNPSVTETFGNVTLEAMSSGLPSVCTAASGTSSLVQSGVNGLLRTPDDGAEGLAGAIVELAGDKALRDDFSSAALTLASGYEWTAILDRLIDDYRDALSENVLPRRGDFV